MNRGGRGAHLLAWGAALGLTIALWPPFAAPLDGSFDSSWRWAVNVAAARQLDAGLLPAGPLGHWLEPRATAVGSLTAAALLQLSLRLGWLLALVGLFRRDVGRWRWLAWALATLAGLIVAGRWPDVEWLCLMLALMAPWLVGEREDGMLDACLLVAGFFAGLAPFVKLSLGAQAWALLAAGVLARRVRWRDLPGRGFVRLAVGGGTGLALGALASFSALGSMLEWMRSAPAILLGYGASMALFDRPAAERIGLAAALLAIVGLALAMWRRSSAVPLWAAAAPALLAAAKYALVRQDVHALAPVVLMSGTCALAGLVARDRRAAVAAFACGGLLVALGLPLHSGERRAWSPRAVGLVEGRAGLNHALDTLLWRSRERDLLKQGGRRLAGLVGDADRELVTSSESIDVVPWRLTLLEALGLDARWAPSPTFQLYQASTAALDRRVASHFAGDEGAAELLVHFDPIDGRQPLWEAPLAWRSIVRAYDVSGRTRKLLALRRRSSRRTASERVLGAAVLSWNDWHQLPAVAPGERLVAELELTPNLAGRWHRLWKRAEPVWIDLRGRGGLERWRALPDLAGEGLEIGAAPRSLDELADWLTGEPVASPRRVRLRSADARRYRPVQVRWLAVTPGA